MLAKESTGLIVVDLQGRLARLVANSDELIANCAKLIEGAQTLGLPIVWLEQNPEKLGETVPELATLMSVQQPIAKYVFNACDSPEFISAVNAAGCSSWLICGIEAHICVYQTTRRLQQMGRDMNLVVDCISSRTLENKELAVRKLMASGVEITSLEMCLYEMVRDCRAPEFKPILKLIK